MDTALEETEKRFDLKLDRKVTMPNRKYMGAGKPRVLAVRSTGGPAPGQRLKPADKPAQPAPQPAQGNGTGKGSAFTFDAAKRAKSANPSPPLVSTTFEYEIVHQTLANVADTWKDARATNSSTRPTSLLVWSLIPFQAFFSLHCPLSVQTSRCASSWWGCLRSERCRLTSLSAA